MIGDPRVGDCIEYRANDGIGRSQFSVGWYVYAMERYWRGPAPAVEELTTEWQAVGDGEFRIRVWDVYDRQMRKMIGLDPRPAEPASEAP